MDPINAIIRLQVVLLFETIYMQLNHTWILLTNKYVTMPTTKRTFTVEQPFLCLCSASKSFHSMGKMPIKVYQLLLQFCLMFVVVQGLWLTFSKFHSHMKKKIKKHYLFIKKTSFTKNICIKCFHTANFTAFHWKCILESNSSLKHYLNPPKTLF